MKSKMFTLLLLLGSTPLFAQGPWLTTGNAIAPTDFLGTTNVEPLSFRTNNIEAMRIDGATQSIGIGTAPVPGIRFTLFQVTNAIGASLSTNFLNTGSNIGIINTVGGGTINTGLQNNVLKTFFYFV